MLYKQIQVSIKEIIGNKLVLEDLETKETIGLLWVNNKNTYEEGDNLIIEINKLRGR